MAINQAEIFVQLEKLCDFPNKSEFIYGFLEAYGFPSATITRLKSGERNVALDARSGDIALKKSIYFKPAMVGEDIYELADLLKAQTIIGKQAIRFIVVTDWIDVIAYDLKVDEKLECSLESLHENYAFFLPLAGYEKAQSYSENPADTKAAEQMGRLFSLIKEKNRIETAAEVHALNVFLTRLLFCFFAEDTGIFDSNQMTTAIESTTNVDGSDVAKFFVDMFEVLNEPKESPVRLNKPKHFTSFPYVNGGLFKQSYPIPEFTNKARRILIDCGSLQWEDINPDIFGSMFQSVIDEDQRGNLGQHYTSVTNILKVIQPLFLDKLHEDLEKAKHSKDKLTALLDRISKIKIFDPACGSGNFLIIAYKELRKIEMAVFKAIDEVSSQKVMFMSSIRLSQFYGIEIDDFAHEIALLSLWLTEHQMNQAFKAEFGYSPPSLPLKESGNIVAGNSLRRDWNDICPKTPADEVYVCGNPPYLGANNRNSDQNDDMDNVFYGFDKHRYLDFVACWFWLGSKYISNSIAEVAFVSTNSICQGIQVEMLWPSILDIGINIKFAYQSFPWRNSAKENAGVHVAIIGLTAQKTIRRLFSYIDDRWHEANPENINPYLVASKNIIVRPRSQSFGKVPKMLYGNKPADGGHLFLTQAEKDDLLLVEPLAEKWIKKILGADEFLNNTNRYCLWLGGIEDEELAKLPNVEARIKLVKKMRLASKKEATRKLAEVPHLFGEIRHPSNTGYILIPYTTSERREYVPMGFFDPSIIASNANQIIPGGTLYEVGILMSNIHMDWMRAVGGRLESRYRYSATLVYNTFPWPTISDNQKTSIEKLSENILLTRERYPEKNLAQLYDPDLMPADLLAAHHALDSAVDKLYRDRPFRDSSDRLEHLFKLYEKLAASSDPKNMKIGSTEDLW